MTQASTFVLHNVSRLDALRLKNEPGISFEPESVPAGSYGEPSTFVMLVTYMALRTLASYMLREKHSEDRIEEIEEVRTDGTRVTRRIRITSEASSPGKNTDKILKQITGDLESE